MSIRMLISVDYDRLEKQFNKEYKFICEVEQDGGYVAGYDEALEFGDHLIEDRHPVVEGFAQHRRDLLVSDREVAAFAFAVTELGIA